MRAVEAKSIAYSGPMVRKMNGEELLNHFFLSELKEMYFHLEGTTYHNKASDKGGPTKAGVTLAFARRYGIRSINQLRVSSLDELWIMVYKQFFKGWKLWHIDDRSIISYVFLLCLNAGYGVKQIQDAINRTGIIEVTADNKMGPQTRGALHFIGHSESRDEFLSLIQKEFNDYYNYLADKDPVQGAPNRAGWLNRVKRVAAFDSNIVQSVNDLLA